MNKKCNFCGNANLKKTTTQYTYPHNGKYLMVENVPCEQCEYCREQYFQAKVLKSIENEFEQIYLYGKIVTTEIKIPIEKYREIAQ
ncbi:MAG: type II toxin-antitoxin system MqsA family antitoxin [Methylococcales symbiont of Hymedesmia sp. n. MRB-2018]|nr:MAG: type II toxin-antitoxin system MqsA family antitoxin [Methylococcales symbiont of Hymedesmia sp. n. MRB-2018]KAF3984185.1 MAG: type II toxin-antitoxin system MqsA family antitoxin [Methylococcales symbiont of Hymedesmia sp. n. MRB-2018]